MIKKSKRLNTVFHIFLNLFSFLLRFFFIRGTIEISKQGCMTMEKLVLIDGNSLLNRAFYATPVFTTKDGIPTNGVFGFVKLLLKIISDKKPTHLAVAFDVHAPTFRHQMYDDYKAGRKPMPEDLRSQFPILKEVLTAMNICVCELAGYEADDIIGTMSKRFTMPTYVYTGDRDAYQLVDATTIAEPKNGFKAEAADIMDALKEQYGFDMDLYLVGDTYFPVPKESNSREIEAIKLPAIVCSLTTGEKLELSMELYQSFLEEEKRDGKAPWD